VSDIKQHLIEKSEQIITHPSSQKALATLPLAGSGAAVFEVTQGWMTIASLAIGIVAGLLVIKYNHKKNKLMDMEIEEKKLIIARLKDKSCEVDYDKNS